MLNLLITLLEKERCANETEKLMKIDNFSRHSRFTFTSFDERKSRSLCSKPAVNPRETS